MKNGLNQVQWKNVIKEISRHAQGITYEELCQELGESFWNSFDDEENFVEAYTKLSLPIVKRGNFYFASAGAEVENKKQEQ